MCNADQYTRALQAFTSLTKTKLLPVPAREGTLKRELFIKIYDVCRIYFASLSLWIMSYGLFKFRINFRSMYLCRYLVGLLRREIGPS
jgi:hypothetical protein